eukprot:CAMPEP_0114612472 /NCGR_PEP_ID=MMETSP0168-20121206/4640_1 /TAXON_ID=95228 ORGANISM="Vannella sp., Strain DIVA3 517/6/12" /NCGR_SAMPLE_ID=MMETSP0168 /ASSEMBLY_ACC=CAM_ASM_000044 /LENGTH=876 /DNA_ID=CAMNT_0001823459 /DNA_START=186 /DNA_END=2816 /DNA_ORIENTATION=-
MSQIDQFRVSLLQVFGLLKSLSSLQYRMLLYFVRCDDDIVAQPLSQLVETIGNEQLKELVNVSQAAPQDIGRTKLEARDEGVRNLSNELITSFGGLFRLTVLQETLKDCLTVEHLMVLYDHVPRVFDDQQVVIFQQLQHFFHNMSDWDISSLHERVQEADAESLQEVIPLPQDLCMLFRPLKGIFQLPLDQVIQFHRRFPKFPPLQLAQLVALMRLQPLEILEIRQLLTTGREGLQGLVEDFNLDPMEEVLGGGTAGAEGAPQYQLQVVEQPPHQTVYKRNLKPNPELMLYGEDDTGSLAEGECLVVVPVLYRCDTQEPMPKRLQGDDPIEVCVGTAIAFRRLKIQVTSHQTDESLFFIKFELRKVLSANPAGEYELLGFVQSNPIQVVSHSTLIKGPTNIVPTIDEVIPCEGTPAGGSRVVVIGSNFMETPAARVAFDGIAVRPEFHGPGTLLCHTPPHPVGVVQVGTSNDGKRWSTSTAPFKYGDEEGDGTVISSLVPSGTQGSTGGLEDAEMTALFDGDVAALEMAIAGQIPGLGTRLDAGGFNVMHYATSLCSHSPSLLLRVLSLLTAAGCTFDVRDRRGNTPLHWLLLFGSAECVRAVLSRCPASLCALPNADGVALSHIAAALDKEEALGLLLAKGLAPTARTVDGATPLHLAAASASLRTLSLLLRFSVGLSRAVDDEGETPLHYAVRENSPAAVRSLVAAGSPLNLQSAAGESPAHLACATDNAAALEALLEAAPAGALQLDIKDETGATPLISALSARAIGAARLILAHSTAAHVTAGESESTAGARVDVNSRDCFGRSALSLAAGQEATELLDSLRKCGAVDPKSAKSSWAGAMGSGFASRSPAFSQLAHPTAGPFFSTAQPPLCV